MLESVTLNPKPYTINLYDYHTKDCQAPKVPSRDVVCSEA